MKKEIKVIVKEEVVKRESKTIEVDFPEVPKFFAMEDEGKFFPRGVVLFAIIPKYPNSIGTYLLVEVERGNQKYTDFVPNKDPSATYWLSEKNGIRHKALDILTTNTDFYQEITQEEFETRRVELLDVYKTNSILNPDY